MNNFGIPEYANQWLDEPINLPILTDYIHPSQQRQPLKVEQTAQLLQEFDSVFGADQFTFTSAPQSQQQIILNSNFFNFDHNESIPSPESNEDIAHEMEVVEELVRSCAENLPNWTSDDDNSSESCSAGSSPRSSSDDSFDTASQSFSNDDEWCPAPQKATLVKKRPYKRSLDDKKSRKKEQNKNAATRYRQKKKAESEIVLEEERELQEKNNKLQEKYVDIQREIKYLKSLMRDLYRAKGLL
ncbi:Activating transcription factor of chaperone [Pseudolycoriella hygida]|uniref:Activating transcription factor of chaperone n=1 Tax=Pseudolycoriella hygida TaxID=35572 RepID=A0A9Q0NFX2_9DIPT|nr:Activating transcription factor of chaperone [Pseudolycoriella hygida]